MYGEITIFFTLIKFWTLIVVWLSLLIKCSLIGVSNLFYKHVDSLCEKSWQYSFKRTDPANYFSDLIHERRPSNNCFVHYLDRQSWFWETAHHLLGIDLILVCFSLPPCRQTSILFSHKSDHWVSEKTRRKRKYLSQFVWKYISLKRWTKSEELVDHWRPCSFFHTLVGLCNTHNKRGGASRSL